MRAHKQDEAAPRAICSTRAGNSERTAARKVGYSELNKAVGLGVTYGSHEARRRGVAPMNFVGLN